MKSLNLFIAIIMLAVSFPAFAAKTVKIKLTGSVKEPIMMTVGTSGRTEVISSLPYVLEVPKNEMPVHLSFVSDNFVYYDINVPKKPVDTTGHVYLLKIDESETARLMTRTAPTVTEFVNTPQKSASKVKGIDVTHGVNKAPLTGSKNEKSFALIISNEEYEYVSKVDNACNDGLALKEYCIRTLGMPGENVMYLSNLSYGKMRKAINDMLSITELLNGEANLLVYYAGHGIPDNKTKGAYLLPVDADGKDTDICFPLDEFYNKLGSANLKQCVVLLDACFSGANRDGDMLVAARGVKIKPKESQPTGNLVVLSATSGDEAAYSHDQESHGLFTYYLLKKLQESEGKASLGELSKYVTEQVALQSRRINGQAQTPTVHISTDLTDKLKSLKLNK